MLWFEEMAMVYKIMLILVVATLSWFATSGAQEAVTRQRLTPIEIEALAPTGSGAGTSGVSGIHTRVLKGDPARSGPYTIQLTVPAKTRIQAHVHPDDRVAIVVSGTWYFGYGSGFDEKKLKALPPGSFYTEPPDDSHFARTGNTPVVVLISGFGPSGTKYTDQ